ncbi:MAG: 50S ribosomal protein L31 [Phycisphaerae bacterium]|nr:50S ribosomal protein L31 [Phycisphaerae bacterium]
MNKEIHPEYSELNVTCACGNKFTTRSTRIGELQIEICSNCHPFYTGKQKYVDTAGRVEKFQRKFGTDYFKKPGKDNTDKK